MTEFMVFCFFFQAEDGIRDLTVTGVQTCALPIYLFTLTSDTFPAQAVGSVVGMGGMAGAIGGMLIAKIVGYTLQWTGSYMVPFLIAGFAYLLALAAIQLLVPKLDPASIH